MRRFKLCRFNFNRLFEFKFFFGFSFGSLSSGTVCSQQIVIKAALIREAGMDWRQWCRACGTQDSIDKIDPEIEELTLKLNVNSETCFVLQILIFFFSF